MQTVALQKWQYHVEEFSSVPAAEQTFKQLGEQGWELVSVVGGNCGEAAAPVKTLRRKSEAFRAFFKRPADEV